jgi:uncharacterized repeat protein (TIGR01451 family)
MQGLFKIVDRLLRLLLMIALLCLPVAPATADLRTPAWYDSNAVTLAPDWHYRVPISVPAGASINSTIKLDADFNALLAAMGVTGTFDVNSPRVVRSTGALSTIQEFTDRIYGGVTDSASNGRGEIRFLLEDAGAVTYYLYFDVTQNGLKTANPQTPINGNFERGATGTAQPVGWNAPMLASANFDASVRPAETVTVQATPASVEVPNPTPTDGNPLTGDFSYLYGWRTSTAAQTTAATGVSFSRTITVPITSPGSITFRYRPEGFDSGNFDYTRIDLATTADLSLLEMVGPTAAVNSPATAGYAVRPFAPSTGANAISAGAPGYRAYNTFDCPLNSPTHTLTAPAMTVACRTQTWFTVTQSLAAYAGQTIKFRVRSTNDNADQTWYSIDDIEWSVVTGTLGTPESFGVNITSPATGTGYIPGQIIPITAQVDANPTAATTPVTAQIYDTAGVLAAGGPYILYNDGTHGDVTAGDAIWSNNGSVLAQPAPTVPLGAAGNGWTLRVFARDATTSSIAATANGLAHVPTTPTPETQPDFWNVDELLFNTVGANISVNKTSSVTTDPVNGASNPKMIPGATVRYCVLVTNNGPAAALTVITTDTLPPETTYVPGSMKSGTTCIGATTVEDDNNSGADESDPFGASISGTNIVAITSSLANAAVMAITFDVTIN